MSTTQEKQNVRGTAPTVKPPSQTIKYDAYTEYIVWSPKKLKNGNIVYHKHTTVRMKKPIMPRSKKKTEITREKSRLLNHIKNLLLLNDDITDEDIKRFYQHGDNPISRAVVSAL
jgi:hypothetical protein